jgi:hypothetical protein
LQMIVFYTDKSIIMMIQSLYNKTWTTWQLGKKYGYAVSSRKMHLITCHKITNNTCDMN